MTQVIKPAVKTSSQLLTP